LKGRLLSGQGDNRLLSLNSLSRLCLLRLLDCEPISHCQKAGRFHSFSSSGRIAVGLSVILASLIFIFAAPLQGGRRIGLATAQTTRGFQLIDQGCSRYEISPVQPLPRGRGARVLGRREVAQTTEKQSYPEKHGARRSARSFHQSHTIKVQG
jgi:hypothetical protein